MSKVDQVELFSDERRDAIGTLQDSLPGGLEMFSIFSWTVG